MKLPIAVLLFVLAAPAHACGRLPAAQQKTKDEADRAREAGLVAGLATAADRIMVGVVDSLQADTVVLRVLQTFKGPASRSLTAGWQPRMVLSCEPWQGYQDVDFRVDGKFVVYIKDGRVIRSAAAEKRFRTGSPFPLDAEIALVRASGTVAPVTTP